MTTKLNLWPVVGINVYAIPIPEMVESFKRPANDPEYPEAIHKALEKQRQPDRPTDNTVVSLF